MRSQKLEKQKNEGEILGEVLAIAMSPEIRQAINGFLDIAKKFVEKMLEDHPKEFRSFKKLQKKGVQWSHSDGFRRVFEKNGFVFRPMIIKRDTMECEKCGAKASSFYENDIPNYYHKLACEFGPTEETNKSVRPWQRLIYYINNNLIPVLSYPNPSILWEIGRTTHLLKEISNLAAEYYGFDVTFTQQFIVFNSTARELLSWGMLESYINSNTSDFTSMIK